MRPAPRPLLVWLVIASAALLAFCPLGCVEQRSIGTQIHEDGVRPRPVTALSLEPEATILAGVDGEGVLRFFDASGESQVGLSGLFIAEAAPDAGGGSIELSARADGAGLHRLALLARDEEEVSGALFDYPFAGAGFARRRDLGAYEGPTQVLAVGGGTIVFQSDLGQRWLMARHDGQWWSSLPCGVPQSILSVEEEGGAVVVRALTTYPDGLPALLEVTASESGFERCDRRPLAVEGTAGAIPRAATVRAVELGEPMGDVLVDVVGGELAVGAEVDGKVVLSPTGVPALGVEHAIAWGSGDERAVVVIARAAGGAGALASVIGLALDEDGELTVASVASAPILASVAEAGRVFRRDAVRVADRLYVATSAGVMGFAIAVGDGQVSIAPVPLAAAVVALRGPLLALPALD